MTAKAIIDRDVLRQGYLATGTQAGAAAAVGVNEATLRRHRRNDPDLDAFVREVRAEVRAIQRDALPHGRTRYNYGCRCEKCTQANRDAHARLKVARRDYPPEKIPHGVGGYRNYGCRCEVCSTAASEAMREYREGLKGVA